MWVKSDNSYDKTSRSESRRQTSKDLLSVKKKKKHYWFLVSRCTQNPYISPLNLSLGTCNTKLSPHTILNPRFWWSFKDVSLSVSTTAEAGSPLAKYLCANWLIMTLARPRPRASGRTYSKPMVSSCKPSSYPRHWLFLKYA